MDPQVSTSSGQHSQAASLPESSPIAFKQQLLAALNDECEIMDLLSMRKWDQIVIIQFQGTKYVLICDAEALPRSVYLRILLIMYTSDWSFSLRFEELDDDIIYCYFQLKYTRDKRRQVLESFSSTLPKHPASAQLDGDIFLPIGSLAENFKYRDNGYVCMLNLSTNPISIWALYDYHHDSDKPICEYKPMTRAKSVMWGSDLILLYEDIKDWDPNSGSVTPWKPPGQEMYGLGNMVRGHTVFPPEDLLDAVTQDQDDNNTVEEREGNEHVAEIEGGSAAQ